MKTLNMQEVKQISGAKCSWHGLGQGVAGGAAGGVVTGALIGTPLTLGTLTIPAAAAGGAIGGLGGAATYGATCWW